MQNQTLFVISPMPSQEQAVENNIEDPAKKNKIINFAIASWDILMVLIAIVNLSIILFDLTYLFMRPYYFHYYKDLLFYDEVKGIEPHRLTEEYIQKFQEIKKTILEKKYIDDDIRRQQKELSKLSVKIIDSNPFEIAGRTKDLESIKFKTIQFINDNTIKKTNSAKAAFIELYRFQNTNAEKTMEFIETEIIPPMKLNYYRKRSVTGNFVDNFWSIDWPFLIIFFIEFMVRWFIAIKKRVYVRWFFFPIYNWYDTLALIPTREMRLFRLFRIIAIYQRLKKSNFAPIGNDIFSRTFKKYYDIATEEISDLVSIKILSDVQDEISVGSSTSVLTDTLRPRKDDIRKIILENSDELAREVLIPIKPKIKELVSVSMNESSKKMHLPAFKLIEDRIASIVVETVYITIISTLESQKGKEIIGDLIENILEKTLEATSDHKVDELVKEMLIAAIENVKKKVAVKKWMIKEKEAIAAHPNANFLQKYMGFPTPLPEDDHSNEEKSQ